MKPVYVVVLFTIVTAVGFGGYGGVALAANQPEVTIPQSGDLCGGTGGNGQIVSVGNNSFTLKRNDGNNLIVNLAGGATIETSSGSVSLSDLKIGERVTLVGSPNTDRSFNAYGVFVCSGAGQRIQSGQKQAADFNKAKAWSSYLDISGMLLVGLFWIGTVVFLRFKKRKSPVYLLFFTIFYVYIVTVLYYTLFRFQSLLLLKYFAPNIMLNGVAAAKSLNLIPLITLTLKDARTSFLNILLFMPFGFGLPFITNFRMKKAVITGTLFSITIELLQLITGLAAKMTFRIADINDVIFNTVGVVIGYMLFVGFVRMYRHITHSWKISTNPILRYIAERPQVDK
jgi:glycopeptide antibiotics resistance protein